MAYDKHTIARIANGDEEAFAALFNHFQTRFYTVASVITHSTQAAEELIQDVFLKVWMRRKDLPDIENLEAYLFIVMRNECYAWMAHKARRKNIGQFLSDNAAAAIMDTDDLLRQHEFKDLIRKAIQQLTPQQQEVFRLMRQEGLSREQTAEILHIDENTIKTHMSRALRNIRAWCMANGQI